MRLVFALLLLALAACGQGSDLPLGGGAATTGNASSTGSASHGTTSGASSTGSGSSMAGSSSSTSSSSTGSTGTGSTGTSTSSSSTTSSSGSTGSQDPCSEPESFCCGGVPTPCNDGQHCMPFGDQPGIPRYYACACTPGDPDIGMPDSCRDTNDIPGGNGLVVCDATTYDCRPPRDFEQIFDYATTADEACAPNFAYVHVPDVLPDGGQTGFVLPDGGFVPDLPDGGLLFICMERCSVDGGQGCSANWTHCVAGAFLESDGDGGQSPVDGCLANGCGPDVDAGDYYAPCDADGQPGTCQPQPSATGYSGLCLKTGSAALGDACSGLRGLATDAGLLCGANALCIGTGLAPGGALPPATCAQVCDSAQLTPGLPDCQGATTCTKFDGDPVAPDLQAGYCR